MWAVLQTETNEVHVMPIDDIIAHEQSEDCVCGPETERIETDDGGDNWMYTHDSLDGREARE